MTKAEQELIAAALGVNPEHGWRMPERLWKAIDALQADSVEQCHVDRALELYRQDALLRRAFEELETEVPVVALRLARRQFKLERGE